MFDASMVWGIILTSVLVTVALRLLPFSAISFFKDNAYLQYLSQHMPVGVTLLLVAFTFKDVRFDVAPYGLPLIIATLLCVAAYLLSQRTLLAIAVGLGSHLLMVNSSILDFIR